MIGRVKGALATQVFDASGLTILPGVIDSQVHFREPGLEHKETIESGSRAAVLGGVTGFLEMPNTKPSTTTREALEWKLRRAGETSWCRYGFFIGASSENLDELTVLENLPGCAGIKVFMGSSTGSLLVWEQDKLEKAVRNGRRRMAIHAEDEELLRQRKATLPVSPNPALHPAWRNWEVAYRATKRITELAQKYQRPIHILHISSEAEMAYLRGQKQKMGTLVSVETLPQFLIFEAPQCYEKLGTLVQMNPPIRYSKDRAAVWRALEDQTVDVIATDHAPHTLEEKLRPYPESPSGMPGVQTLVPALLNFVNEGRLSLRQFVEFTSTRPAQIYGIRGHGSIQAGFDASLTIVDMNLKRRVERSWLASLCGWSPYEGMSFHGWPVGTLVEGQMVMWRDELFRPRPLNAYEFTTG